MLDCTLVFSEVPLHLYQITAGFLLLKRSGRIRLSVKRLAPDSKEKLPYNMLLLEADGKRIIYDMNDGYDNLPQAESDFVSFYNGLLGRCDLMFKRSYNAELNARLETPEKLKKIAPNFLVTVAGNPAHLPSPCDPRREKIKKLVRMLPATEFYNGYCYENNFFFEPTENDAPRALFMARLWDPAGEFPGQLSPEKSEERAEINDSRAACIRLCRKELGDRFFGGIAPSEFSCREYPDLILENGSLSKKNKYLEYMKTFDIHIATMGLHRSTGWKFAEYIAAARAVVTEPLYYESAGGLAEGMNYLSFADAEECVEKTAFLLDNRDARYEMMRHNKAYADANMGCATLVGESLRQAGLI